MSKSFRSVKSFAVFSNGGLVAELVVKFAIFNICNMVVGVSTAYLLLSRLDLEAIGYIGVYQGITTLLPRIIGMGCTSFVVSQGVRVSRMQFRRTLRLLLSWMMLAGFLLLLGSFGLFFVISDSTAGFVIFSAVISSVAIALGNLHGAFLVQSGKALTFGFYRSGGILAAFMLTLFLFEAGAESLQNRIFSLVIVDLVLILFRVLIFRRFFLLNLASLDLELLKSFSRYGLPIILGAMAGWFFFDFDKLFFARFYGGEIAGQLTAALWVGALLGQVNEVLRQVGTPLVRQWCRRFTLLGLYRTYIGHLFFLLLAGLIMFFAIFLIPANVEGVSNLVSNPFVPLSIVFFAFNGSFTSLSIVLEYFGESKFRFSFLAIFSLLKVLLSFALLFLERPPMEVFLSTVGFYILFVSCILFVFWKGRIGAC